MWEREMCLHTHTHYVCISSPTSGREMCTHTRGFACTLIYAFLTLDLLLSKEAELVFYYTENYAESNWHPIFKPHTPFGLNKSMNLIISQVKCYSNRWCSSNVQRFHRVVCLHFDYFCLFHTHIFFCSVEWSSYTIWIWFNWNIWDW